MVDENEFSELIQTLEQKISKIEQSQQQEQEFARLSEQRFQSNLAAFEKYQPNVAESIKKYQPEPDFKLYVTRSGEGNFIPRGSKFPLYSDSPTEQASEQVQKYSDKATFGRMGLYKSAGKAPESDPRIHISYMYKLMKLIAGCEGRPSAARITTLPDEYPSCLIFGIGLGYHLPILLNRCRFDYVFVCEPDFELFYASLFCIDWSSLLENIDSQNAAFILHVGIPYKKFFNEIQSSASQIGAFSIINSFCYQHYPSKEINQQIKTFFEQFYRFQNGFGFFDDALNGFAHMALNLESKAQFLRANVKNSIQSMPVFIVANGPSLDESLDFIKENQHKAVIIAAGTGLQTLLKVGVVPDFHVLVERPRSVYEILRQTTTAEQLSQLNLLSVEVVYPDTVDCYKWVGLGLKGPEASTYFLKILALRHGINLQVLRNAGPLVTNTALAFATTFGFKEIYLFGVDNGTPESLSSTHSKLSIYNDSRYAGKYKPNVGSNMSLPGNLGGNVKTSSLLAISKLGADDLVSNYQKHGQVYNVGHGAKIDNAIPVREEDLLVVSSPGADKQKIIEAIKAKFFTSLDFKIDEQMIAVNEFESLVDYLIEINDRPIESRRDASEILKSQSRVVFAYQQTANIHLFHMLKGALLYFHCPLITLLYTYEDELFTLDVFKQALGVWKEYLTEMKSMYKHDWKTKCALMPNS
ncbi:6-hydroxymethylpterin diphosphokinase MptE-like protein [Rheinheimera sp.]|uniref:motility associated factor glycosyltransferase family protein n=1 Tax=Rheinheimera sp. TaxID=1869214 RepID=UPI00307DA7A3